MITLHGFAYSNYYNIIKHVLLYKNIPFTESLQYGANEQFLEISPAGKIPAITTDQGIHLSESSVCCDYLEDAYPEEPLYPANNEARAQARQIMKISELYLEQPCRRLIPFVFTQTAVPKVVAEEVRNTLSRGIEALIHLCVFHSVSYRQQTDHGRHLPALRNECGRRRGKHRSGMEYRC